MKLRLVHTTIIRLTAPYNFDYWEPGKLWFSFRFKDKLLGIKFANQGTVPKPKIQAEFYYKSKLDKEYTVALLKELDYRFEFSKDYSEFYEKFKAFWESSS